MHSELKIKSDSLNRVEEHDTNYWVDLDANTQYSDIGIDQETLLLEELKKGQWKEIITDRLAKNPWLYRIITDKGRSLFIDLLPIKNGGRFLDIGSGWGQIAIPLSQYGHVFCLDVTKSRLNILREIAYQENVTLNYVCGNFLTFPLEDSQFDLVIFNGALEWMPIGNPNACIWEAQKAAIEKACRILNPGGIVYVGIENSLGLKYLLGAPDDHTGIINLTFLNEIEANILYQKETGKELLRTKTWSLSEYKAMFIESGLEIMEIYCCLPDYKIIRQMIPINDFNNLILQGTIQKDEHSGIDGAPLHFIEKMSPIYNLLAKNGVAHYFCPSYGFIAQKPI